METLKVKKTEIIDLKREAREAQNWWAGQLIKIIIQV